MKTLRDKGLAAGFILMALLLVNLVVTFQTAQAAAGQKEFAQLNVAIPLADNLIALKGNTVTVSFSSGQTMTGVVMKTGFGITTVINNLLQKEGLGYEKNYSLLEFNTGIYGYCER